MLIYLYVFLFYALNKVYDDAVDLWNTENKYLIESVKILHVSFGILILSSMHFYAPIVLLTTNFLVLLTSLTSIFDDVFWVCGVTICSLMGIPIIYGMFHKLDIRDLALMVFLSFFAYIPCIYTEALSHFKDVEVSNSKMLFRVGYAVYCIAMLCFINTRFFKQVSVLFKNFKEAFIGINISYVGMLGYLLVSVVNQYTYLHVENLGER